MLNAPRVFSALWALARVFVDPRTAAKVAVLSPGPAQLAALREHLDDSHIPASLGGSRPEPKAGDREGEVYGRLDAWLRERAAAEQAGRMAAPPAASATAAEPAVEAGAEAGAAAAAAAGPAAEAGAPAEVPPSS